MFATQFIFTLSICFFGFGDLKISLFIALHFVYGTALIEHEGK